MTSRSSALGDWFVIVLALLLGLGSILLFALCPLGTLSMVRPARSEQEVLLWDTVVSLVFFVQHSVMNRRWFREWLSLVVSPRYQGALYAIASGAALSFVVFAWEPSRNVVWAWRGAGQWMAYALSALALGWFVWAATALRSFDPLGLRPIMRHRRGQDGAPSVFAVRGPYRWVRHPLYSGIILAIWVVPSMTADRLLFAIIWTAWMAVGARLEETDLVREFGDRYHVYRRFVPMLIPWRLFGTRPIVLEHAW